jgi:hypothetical protein
MPPVSLIDSASGIAYWTANAMDAEQHLTQQTAGNGLVTTQTEIARVPHFFPLRSPKFLILTA